MKYFLFLFIILPTFVFGQSMHDVCPLKIGSAIPEETVIYNDKGLPEKLVEITKDKPTVVIFYRGAWCGYCTQHLAAIEEIRSEIEASGFQILAISPDNFGKMDLSKEKTKSTFQFFSDYKAETIQSFGLNWQVEEELFIKYKTEYKIDLEEWSGQDHHSLPVPAIYIIKDNLIQFNYVNPNYQVRLNPETLLAILKTM